MTHEPRFGPILWILIVLLFAGSVGCFGYAGKQLVDVRASRHGIDAKTPKLRSPVSFQRTQPTVFVGM